MRFLFFISVFSFLINVLYSQEVERGVAVDDDKLVKSSVSLGVNVHSFGYGGEIVYARSLSDSRWEQCYTLNFASYKHKKELKIPSLYSDAGGADYIFGKMNYCYVMGLTYGMQYKLLGRSEFSRVKVSTGLSAGLSLAFLKPYMLEIWYPINPPQARSGFSVLEQYDPTNPKHNSQNIVGEGDYFAGFNNLYVMPGIKCLWLNNIDLHYSNLFIRAIQVGVQVDVFFEEVPIMGIEQNKNIFFGGYLGIMIGNAY